MPILSFKVQNLDRTAQDESVIVEDQRIIATDKPGDAIYYLWYRDLGGVDRYVTGQIHVSAGG